MTQIEASATAPMTGKWKPYQIYKDSGVEWIGEIPEGWNTIPLKRTTVFVSRGNSPEYVDESFIRVINQACVYWDGLRLENVKYYREENVSNLKGLLRSGDLLINSTGTGTLGRAIYFNQSGTFVADSHVTIVRTLVAKLHVRYLFYLIRSPLYQGYVYAALVSGSTNQVELSREGLLATPTILPSLPEQLAIAAFLDHETARIKALIAKKKRLIELLQEKRATLISHVVTKGLDPTVLMKDSGVEWLGEIPAHWDACQFKRVADISYGLTLELDRTETKGTPIISLPNVTKGGQLLLDDVPLTPLTAAEKKDLLLRKGDLLFNWRNGSPDHVGKTAFFSADGEYTHVSFLLRIRLDLTKYDSRYYQMFLNNLRSLEFFSSAKNRVNKTYNQTELGRLEVMVPPLEEQRKIAAYLEHETVKIDALISKIIEGIEKLKEYSTALISAAVTGKIDVRDEITLPDNEDL